MELSDITLFGIPLWKWLLTFALAYGAREAYRGWAENDDREKKGRKLVAGSREKRLAGLPGRRRAADPRATSLCCRIRFPVIYRSTTRSPGVKLSNDFSRACMGECDAAAPN